MSRPDFLPTSAAEAICAALASDLARLIENDPEVRRGVDIEAVHQARVATRRFRSQLRTFGHVMKKGKAGRVSSELKHLARLLGAVRDIDVMRERISGAGGGSPAGTAGTAGTSGAPGQPDEGAGEDDVNAAEASIALEAPAKTHPGDVLSRVPATVVAEVVARLGTERDAGFSELSSEMDSPSYRKLLDSLSTFVSRPPLRTLAAQPASDVLGAAAESAWRRLEDEVASLPPVPTDAQLHRVRIAAKRARYACQVATPYSAEGCDRLARRLARLQDVLGELNDASRAEAWLTRLRADPSGSARLTVVDSAPSIPFLAGVDLLIARERVSMADARTNWPKTWSKVLEAAIELGWSKGPCVREPAQPMSATSGG